MVYYTNTPFGNQTIPVTPAVSVSKTSYSPMLSSKLIDLKTKMCGNLMVIPSCFKMNCNHWNSMLLQCVNSYYNPGHNILILFNNLAQVWITTSKTILDTWHNKRGTRVASRVAERLKTYQRLNPTAFSPLREPLCPHKKKKRKKKT